MFISYCVSLKCRGRVVTNVVRTCDPTPLLYIFGNKIYLNLLMIDRESDANFAQVHTIIIMVVQTLMSIILFRHSEIGQIWIYTKLRSLLISKRGT